VLKCFDMADTYILLTTLDMPALKNLKVTLDTLDNLGFPRTKWQVVLNRGGSRVGLSPADIERTVGVPISVEIPSSVEVPLRLNEGVTVFEASPRHVVGKAFQELAEKQRRSGNPAKAPAAAKRSLFRRG
jgi:pilus assembly protein CpaE